MTFDWIINHRYIEKCKEEDEFDELDKLLREIDERVKSLGSGPCDEPDLPDLITDEPGSCEIGSCEPGSYEIGSCEIGSLCEPSLSEHQERFVSEWKKIMALRRQFQESEDESSELECVNPATVPEEEESDDESFSDEFSSSNDDDSESDSEPESEPDSDDSTDYSFEFSSSEDDDESESEDDDESESESEEDEPEEESDDDTDYSFDLSESDEFSSEDFSEDSDISDDDIPPLIPVSESEDDSDADPDDQKDQTLYVPTDKLCDPVDQSSLGPSDQLHDPLNPLDQLHDPVDQSSLGPVDQSSLGPVDQSSLGPVDQSSLGPVDRAPPNSPVIHRSNEAEAFFEFTNVDILPVNLKDYPVLLRYLTNLWKSDADIMVRFVSIVSLYLNIILLIDSAHIDLKNNRTFRTLTEYYLRECERKILLDISAENVLEYLVDSFSDLCYFTIRETTDPDFIEKCQQYLVTMDHLIDQFNRMI